jgi:hypothetical protein
VSASEPPRATIGHRRCLDQSGAIGAGLGNRAYLHGATRQAAMIGEIELSETSDIVMLGKIFDNPVRMPKT